MPLSYQKPRSAQGRKLGIRRVTLTAASRHLAACVNKDMFTSGAGNRLPVFART
jgi:hypothetical protein